MNLTSAVADIKTSSIQADDHVSREAAVSTIDSMIARVEALKRKV